MANTVTTVIDGSQGEGGGQIVRNAMTYASILGKPIRVTNIRAHRSKPGLQAQHVAALALAADIGGGTLHGADLGAVEFAYEPNPNPNHNNNNNNMNNSCSDKDDEQIQEVYDGIVKTAGSICLLLQAALPCALLVPTPRKEKRRRLLNLKGGTNASMAPQYDYWERIFLPTLQRLFLGFNNHNHNHIITARVLKRGYFPKGGGHVQVTVPSLGSEGLQLLPLKSFDLTERGHVTHITIRSFHAGKMPRHAAIQMSQAALKHLQENLADNCPPPLRIQQEIVTETNNAVGNGLGILIVATTSTGCLLGGSSLCSPKQNANDAGRLAAQELVETLQEEGCVDEWLQDQLILYMALANGTSKMLTGSLTLHTQTAIQVAEQLVPGVVFQVQQIIIEEQEQQQQMKQAVSDSVYGQEGRISGKHLITCHGIGYTGDRST